MLPGHERCRGAQGLLGTLCHAGMHIPARANGSSLNAPSSTTGSLVGPSHGPSASGSSSPKASDNLTAPIPPSLQGLPPTDPLGYWEMAGGSIQPGAFCTICHMQHLLAANSCLQSPGDLLRAFSRLQSKHTDSSSSAVYPAPDWYRHNEQRQLIGDTDSRVLNKCLIKSGIFLIPLRRPEGK